MRPSSRRSVAVPSPIPKLLVLLLLFLLSTLRAGSSSESRIGKQEDDDLLDRDDAQLEDTIGPNWSDSMAPGEICGTFKKYRARLVARGESLESLGPVCAELGACDNPINRDAAIPSFVTPSKTYRLSIHVLCENGGWRCAATQADVSTAVARLNTDYAPWHIQFVADSTFINNTKYRYLADSEEQGMKRSYADSPSTKINIYVVDTGGPCWGTFPWWSDALTYRGGIVMDVRYFGVNSPYPTILTHEVGHCLGLWHVFHGTDEVDQCSACYEPAGRIAEEGDVTGDWCSDTNPTRLNNSFCDDPPGTDPCNGNSWLETPYLNYMSYSNACHDHFTPQQAGRMHCWTSAVLRGWLVSPTPPGAPTLTKLSGGQVLVEWADNSNDEVGFRVQREKKSGPKWINTQIIADVAANTTSITDAPGTGTFRYRVMAYNGADSAWTAWTQINN